MGYCVSKQEISDYYSYMESKQSMIINGKRVLIDSGIAYLIETLNACHFPTIDSCSGLMKDHAFYFKPIILHPYIAFDKSMLTTDRVCFLKKIAERYNFVIHDFSGIPLQKKDKTWVINQLFSIHIRDNETDRDLKQIPYISITSHNYRKHLYIDNILEHAIKLVYDEVVDNYSSQFIRSF